MILPGRPADEIESAGNRPNSGTVQIVEHLLECTGVERVSAYWDKINTENKGKT